MKGTPCYIIKRVIAAN